MTVDLRSGVPGRFGWRIGHLINSRLASYRSAIDLTQKLGTQTIGLVPSGSGQKQLSAWLIKTSDEC